MSLKIRLARRGAKKRPFYAVVVADSRSPRDGRFIEIVGRYNPQTQPSTIDLDGDKIKDWIAKGAQPSDSVKRLLKSQKAKIGLEELLEYLAKSLVERADEVRVVRTKRDGAVVLELHVAAEDAGKVIGRQGRTARALRTLVRASGAHEGERALLEIVDSG